MNPLKKLGVGSQEPKILKGKTARKAARKAFSLDRAAIEPLQAKPQKPGLLAFTLLILYKDLYLLGITLLRRRLRLKRQFRSFLWRLRGMAHARLEQLVRFLKRTLTEFLLRCNAPFLLIKRTYREVRSDIRVKREQGKFPLQSYLAIAEAVGRLLWKILATIFNYAAPVVAAVFLITVIQNRINEPMVYVVDYAGETLGYVNNESEFNAATHEVRSRVTTEGTSAFEILNPHFELMTLTQFNEKKRRGTVTEDAGALEHNALVNKIISKSGSAAEQAYGLYIDEEFLGAVTDKDAVLGELDGIRNRNVSDKPDATVEFVKSVRLKPGLYPKTSITASSDVIGILTGNETADEIYTVKDGDTPSGISDKTGVPYDVLKELNPDIEDKLVEGMEVFTQVARPFMSVQTVYTDVVEEEMPFETIEVENATYAKGYRNVYQEGVNGLKRSTYSVTSIDGLERERTEISFDIIKHPVDERVTVGINNPQVTYTPPVTTTPTPQSPGSTQTPAQPPQAPAQPAPSNSGGFIRPVPYGVGYISCYLNGYWGHTGIDIAVIGGTGTPILASRGGVVVTAKNTGVGYGRYIVIDHGDGYQTLYAHNSALYVNVGDRVAQGQVIAAMGRTGNATGVHCHFEVKYNGRVQNPVNYIGNS